MKRNYVLLLTPYAFASDNLTYQMTDLLFPIGFETPSLSWGQVNMTKNFSIEGTLSGLDFAGQINAEQRANIIKTRDTTAAQFNYYTELLVDSNYNRAL
jgi:hypothetical protein